MPFKHIFLIDDDIDDQELFLTALENVNLSVNCSTAANGLDAFNQLMSRAVSPDLIFLDLNMPLMNGQQFLARIKQQDQFKDIPIIIFTTTSNPETTREVKQLGADELLTKPNSFGELTNLLKSVLSSFS